MTKYVNPAVPDGVGNKVMRQARVALIWAALAAAICVPVAAAAASPLLAWRGPIYILAGFAGILALGLMLVQPVLAGGYLPGLSAWRGRRAHRWIGGALVAAVVIHVGGLWITSPPDMIDALLFTSPTPFSPFGVIAMWAIFAVALLAALRRRLGLRPRTWRIAHMSLAAVIVAGGVVHAILVEGTMETVSKAALCALVLGATIKVMADLRVRRKRETPRGERIARRKPAAPHELTPPPSLPP
jgi:MFS family permease